ncbi:MAG: FAD/NAD(P)-binding oxidoreductase [Halothiobacillaceae bacterium]|nr:FAD/NAD(P)-binding oxidoreductase [Halothiobacillaceae bacterium]
MRDPRPPLDDKHPDGLSRRDFLKLMAASSAAATAASAPTTARASVKTNATIVVAGAGAGGLTAANKLARWLDGAKIIIIDDREKHFYQPGYTLVAHGLAQPGDVTSETKDYIPDGAEWIRESVAAFDPDSNTVETSSGRKVKYDFLVVATGLTLDFEKIEGMESKLIGHHGIGSTYFGTAGAFASYKLSQDFIEKGGTAIFTKPNTPMKCAGAPLKAVFLTEYRMQKAGTRAKGEFLYFNDSDKLFSVGLVDKMVGELFAERNIKPIRKDILTAIDPGKKIATFTGPDGNKREVGYDYIHIVPPMSAAAAVKNSNLAWQEGNFATGGWMEVDKETLQHGRYPNVFGVGDINGTPVGKTAATVKNGTPVAMKNLVSVIDGKEPQVKFNGYTSCPLITEIGKAALIEFDYNLELVPTFPFINETDPAWRWWAMKMYMLKPVYYQVIQGRFPS